MKNVKCLLTAVFFALAGVAVHANAAPEQHRCTSGVCFQLTPQLAENGFAHTPLGMQLEHQVENA